MAIPDDLATLKDDMVAFTEGHGMRRFPGYVDHEEVQTVMWKPGDDCAGETCHVGGVPERSDTASWHGLRIVSPNLPRLRLKQSDLSPVMIGAWDWWFGRR